MAIINFPTNPSDGDTYTTPAGVTYVFDSASTSWTVDAAVGYTGSQGFTGSAGSGFTGSVGPLGYAGSRGYTGSQAYTGSRGYTGSGANSGNVYQVDTGTTATSTPSSYTVAGQLLFNNATLTSATEIGLHAQAKNGAGWGTYIDTWDDLGSSTNRGILLLKSFDW